MKRKHPAIWLADAWLYKSYESTGTKGQSLYMAFSKQTYPRKVSVMKQDSSKWEVRFPLE